MKLTAKRIKCFDTDNIKIKKMMKKLFPEHERMNIGELILGSLTSMVDYFGYYDEENELCGFSYVIFTDQMAFILFLAVDDSVQSKGYGSEILNTILQKHDGKTVVLHCEPEDPGAENAQQRSRRINWYKKFGFTVTEYEYEELEGYKYAVMSRPASFSEDEYFKLFKKSSFGFYKPKTRKKNLMEYK